MKREFLIDLGLEKQVIDLIMDENGKDIEKAKKAGTLAGDENSKAVQEKEGVASKSEDKAANENDEEQKNDENQNKAIQGEKPVADDNQYAEKIKNLEAQNKEQKQKFDEDMQKNQFESKLDMALEKINAKDIKLIKPLLDLDKITIVNGNMMGLDEQIKAIKKSHGYLFFEDNYDTGGGNPSNPVGEDEIGSELKRALWGRNFYE